MVALLEGDMLLVPEEDFVTLAELVTVAVLLKLRVDVTVPEDVKETRELGLLLPVAVVDILALLLLL